MSTMSEVVVDITAKAREPDPDVVELLESMLDQARRGEVLAVAVVARTAGNDGLAITAYPGDWGSGDFELAGCIAVLQHRILAAMMGCDE